MAQWSPGPHDLKQRIVPEAVILASGIASSRTLDAYVSTGNLKRVACGDAWGFLSEDLETLFGAEVRSKLEVYRERTRWQQVRMRFAEAAGLGSYAVQSQATSPSIHAVYRLSSENRYLLRLVSMLRSTLALRDARIAELTFRVEESEQVIAQLSAERVRDRILVKAGAGIVQHQLGSKPGAFKGLAFALEWLGLVARAHEGPVSASQPASGTRDPAAGTGTQQAA